jgi:hypothetical protein
MTLPSTLNDRIGAARAGHIAPATGGAADPSGSMSVSEARVIVERLRAEGYSPTQLDQAVRTLERDHLISGDEAALINRAAGHSRSIDELAGTSVVRGHTVVRMSNPVALPDALKQDPYIAAAYREYTEVRQQLEGVIAASRTVVPPRTDLANRAATLINALDGVWLRAIVEPTNSAAIDTLTQPLRRERAIGEDGSSSTSLTYDAHGLVDSARSILTLPR